MESIQRLEAIFREILGPGTNSFSLGEDNIPFFLEKLCLYRYFYSFCFSKPYSLTKGLC